MQDDTGQPTLQDLAASLRAALDAASPLTGRVSHRTASNTDTTTDKAASTTPTPDQGALERARHVAEIVSMNWAANTDGAVLHKDLLAMIEQAAYSSLTAAASEARAAAIAECADTAAALIAHSGINVQDSMRDIVQQIRALATPAQSET